MEGNCCIFEPRYDGNSYLANKDFLTRKAANFYGKFIGKNSTGKSLENFQNLAHKIQDKIIRKTVYGAYSEKVVEMPIFSEKPMSIVNVVPETNLIEEISFSQSVLEHSSKVVAELSDNKSEVVYNERNVYSHEEMKVLHILTKRSEYSNDIHRLNVCNSSMWQTTAAKITRDKQLEKDLAIDSEFNFPTRASNLNDEKGKTVDNSSEMNKESTKIPGFGGMSSNSCGTEYISTDADDIQMKEKKIKAYQDILKIDKGRCSLLRTGQSKIWSEYCYRFGHGTTCPYGKYCMFLDSDLCCLCNKYYLPRNSERKKHLVECLRIWYEKHSYFPSRSNVDENQTAGKHYYNNLSGYTDICETCRHPFWNRDIGRAGEITKRQISQEYERYSDFNVIPNSPWMEVDKSSNPKGKRCDICIWRPNGEFNANDFYPSLPSLAE